MSIRELFKENDYELKCKNLNITSTLDVDVINVSTGIIESTTDSTSTSTGAFIIAGGIGIAKSLHSNTLTTTDVSTGSCSISNTTNSSTTSTGSLIVNGGAGIAKNLHIGEILYGNHFGYNLFSMGTTALYVNTNSLFSVAPITTGSIGSKIISDAVLFSKPYNIIKSSGDSYLSVLQTPVTTRTVIKFYIDSNEYTLLDSTFSGATDLVNSKSEYVAYYQIIPINSTQFDLMLYGYNKYNVPLTVPIGRNGNLIMRDFYVLSTNGGLHYTRGSTYSFDGFFQFSTASTSNSLYILRGDASILNLY